MVVMVMMKRTPLTSMSSMVGRWRYRPWTPHSYSRTLVTGDHLRRVRQPALVPPHPGQREVEAWPAEAEAEAAALLEAEVVQGGEAEGEEGGAAPAHTRVHHELQTGGAAPGNLGQPIRGQYWDRVISADQSEDSIGTG